MRRRTSSGNPAGHHRRETLTFEGGSAVLDGRHVYEHLDLSDEQHQEMVRAMLERIPALSQARDETSARVRAACASADGLSFLAFMSVLYLNKDADTYREGEDDRSPAHVEWLGLQCLPYVGRRETEQAQAPPARDEQEPAGVSPLDWLTEASRVVDDVRGAFEMTSELIQLRSVAAVHDGADTHFEEYRRTAQISDLMIRNSGYSEHVEMVLRECLDPFDQVCGRVMGFTARQSWALGQAVLAVLSRRVRDKFVSMSEEYREAGKMLARMRGKNQLPAELRDLSPTQQKRVFRRLIEASHLRDSLNLITVTAADLTNTADGIDAATATAWLEAHSCEPESFDTRHHGTPCGGHPLTASPVLRIPAGYVIPAPSGLPEVLRPLMEDRLRTAGRQAWADYDRARATWMEKFTAERLASRLPGSRPWSSVPWRAPDDDSDLDGLVSCDDIAFRIQCKAGRISPAARRGAPSMGEDIEHVINDAAHQHARLQRALTENGAAALGFTSTQSVALSAPLTVEVIVCLDSVTVWATEVHKLRHLVTMPDTPQVPWVLSLYDFLAVTDLFEGAELAHYVTRRLRLEAERKVEAHDELDWAGHYITDGLFFDHIFDRPDAPDVYRLLSYTEQIDTWYFARQGLLSRPVDRPSQALPAALRQLLGHLSRDRPDHWLTASLILLHGDEETRVHLGTLMNHTAERSAEVGWSAGSHVYPDHVVTLRADLRCTGPALREQMRDYWTTRLASHGRPNGIAIGLGLDRRLVVDVIETDSERTIAHVLLSRDPSRAVHTETTSGRRHERP